MSIDFIAIDFETANEKRASVCALGLIVFKDGNIDTIYDWLVRPPKHLNHFNPFNIQIHGIKDLDVINKPEFNEIWDDVYSIINNNILVSHNSSFDISVLRQLIDYYDLPYPNIEFVCTCNVARKTWDKQINYTLKNIGNNLGYIFNHHDARDDAITCGKILVDACKYHNCNSIDELARSINLNKGVFNSCRYRPCSVLNPYNGLRKGKYEKIIIDEISQDNINTEGIFNGKNVVFTGTLSSMTRQYAAEKVVSNGGYVSNSINRATNILVMGIQDYERFSDKKQSGKTKKAKQLIQEGYSLEIIDENDFLRILLKGNHDNEYK